MDHANVKVAIIGGGITGLSAAFYVQKLAAEQKQPLDLTVIDSAHRLGGKIHTSSQDGFLIERGPDAFVSRKDHEIRALAEELGISQKIVSSAPGDVHIAANGKLHPLPRGTVMGIPLSLKSLWAASSCSIGGRLRAMADLFLPDTDKTANTPLGSYLRRRFGNEYVENMIEPMFSGVYAGDIDRLSIDSAFPEALKAQGSLMRSLKRQPLSEQREFSGLFETFEGGLETLVQAIEQRLNCRIAKGVKAQTISHSGQQRIVLGLSDGETLEADHVILAIPHRQAAALFEPHGIAKSLTAIPQTSIATVTMIFPEQSEWPGRGGTGFTVARNNDSSISACSISHLKWPALIPENRIMVRSFIGRVGDEAVVELPDAEIGELVMADLNRWLGLEQPPERMVISRWKDAMPQYLAGHETKVSTARSEISRMFPGVQIAGGSYAGFGLPLCVKQGQQAAEAVFNRNKEEMT
ncbi:protoporphyrinogen oxidase [Planococcus plakortidis]|uniref:protoporphyrinogen oxidase n=1 Tax=Planococcus plakortidis TaxID=1038856 RepID=UPI001F02821E|nr:protoporphyrinogen oxidase [Planococcus plakortidis]